MKETPGADPLAGGGGGGPAGGHGRDQGTSRYRTGRSPGAPSLPPRWLDPILTLAEVIDRRRRHISPIRRAGLFGLELRRYKGATMSFPDGCVVHRGDPIGALHFRNDRVRALVVEGWQVACYRAGRADMSALADWLESQPAGPAARRPLAFLGTTILSPFVVREGWLARALPVTWRTRLDAWWMRWMMAHFSRGGRARVAGGHHPLSVVEVWICPHELVRKYGRPASITRAATPSSKGDVGATLAPFHATRRRLPCAGAERPRD